MQGKTRRILSLVLSLGLLFQQIGFAQIATELNIANHLARMASSFTVDKFRPVHLRYFSYDSLTDNFKVLLDKGDLKNLKVPELESSTRTLLSYFLVGVTLPDDMFWVNLRPDSEAQIIDQELEKTDVGKIMLEADLQLKKDTALYTSPQTPEGKEYWDRLYKKAAEIFGNENIEIPTLTRPWIVPGEIIVRESKDSAYVYKATLKVMLEQDYLQSQPTGVIASEAKQSLYNTYSFKDERSKALNEYSTQLIRELIIPKLTKEVNSSKRYAPLRQVYYSLILSRWFKHKFSEAGTVPVKAKNYASQEGLSQTVPAVPSYVKLIDSGDLTNLTSQEPWSKTDYFKQYQKSFSQGEYNIKEPVYTPTGQVIRSYFSGGINVANGAIDTQNGISASVDNAYRLGEVIGGKAVVDPQNISLQPAVAASPIINSGDQSTSPGVSVAEKLQQIFSATTIHPAGFLTDGMKKILSAVQSNNLKEAYRALGELENQLKDYTGNWLIWDNNNNRWVDKRSLEWSYDKNRWGADAPYTQEQAQILNFLYTALPKAKQVLESESAASPITSTASSTLYSLDTQLSRLDRFVNANRGKGSVKGRIEEVYASVYAFISKTATYPSFGVGVTTREATGINEVSQSGTSSGSKEPITLSPKDSYQTEEKGLFDSRIKPLLLGRNVADILKLDEELERIGRAAKPNSEAPDLIFGGPAITATSMALVRALARSAHVDEEVAGFWIYNQLAKTQGAPGLKEMTLPIPMAKVNDGGVHGITFIEEREIGGKIVKVKLPVLPYQEFLFTPVGYTDYFEALQALRDVSKRYYEIIREEVDKNLKFGAEAAIQSNNLRSIVQVLGFMIRAIKETPNGQGVFIARDDAASELYNHPGRLGLYYLGQDGKEYAGSQDGYVTTQQKIEFDKMLNKRFPRIVSLEDGFSEDDRAGWIQGTKELRDRVLVIGDDVFVTAPEIVTDGVKDQVATAVLDKLNQAGTFSRAVLAHIIARILPVKLHQEIPWLIATSHRSGEPAEQNMMAVLAVAAASEFIKTTYGSIAGGGQGRESKVNYLSMTAEKWQNRDAPLTYAGARMLNNPQRGFEKIVKEYTEKGIYTEEDVNRMAASQVTQANAAASSVVVATLTITADDLDRLMRGYPPLPAMVQLTAELKARGIPMGIFTNAPMSVLDKARGDFPNIFTDSDLMIRTADVGQKETETYAVIQQRVKRPVIIIDDEQKFADAAAKATGVRSILVNPDEPLTLEHPILRELVASIQPGDAERLVIFFDISGTLYNNTRPTVFRAVRDHIRSQLPSSVASSLNMEDLFPDKTLDEWLFTGVEASKLRKQPQEITPEEFARTIEHRINEKLQGAARSPVEVLGELKGTAGEDRKEIKIPDSVISGEKQIVIYNILPYAEPSELMILVLGWEGVAESAFNKFSFHEEKGTIMGTYYPARGEGALEEGTLNFFYDREKRNLTLKVLQGIVRESSFVVKLEPAARSSVDRRDHSLEFAQYLESLLEDGASEKRFNGYEVTSSFATQGGGIFRLDGGWQEAINSVPLSKITVSEIPGTGDILVKRKTPAASSPAASSRRQSDDEIKQLRSFLDGVNRYEFNINIDKYDTTFSLPALESPRFNKPVFVFTLSAHSVLAVLNLSWSARLASLSDTGKEALATIKSVKIRLIPVGTKREPREALEGTLTYNKNARARWLEGVLTSTTNKDSQQRLSGRYRIEVAQSSSPMIEAQNSGAVGGIDASASSASMPEAGVGGIDFRALPMTIQPMGSFQGLNFKLPQLSQTELEKMNIAVEMQQIKNMVQAGIIPSGQRIKELIAACVQKGQINSQIDNLLLCLADTFKLEEENASESSPELREALVIVDSQS